MSPVEALFPRSFSAEDEAASFCRAKLDPERFYWIKRDGDDCLYPAYFVGGGSFWVALSLNEQIPWHQITVWGPCGRPRALREQHIPEDLRGERRAPLRRFLAQCAKRESVGGYIPAQLRVQSRGEQLVRLGYAHERQGAFTLTTKARSTCASFLPTPSPS